MIPRRSAPRGGRRDRIPPPGPGASRAARSSPAEGWRARRRPPAVSPSPLPLEALDRLLQRVVFRRGLERLLPDALGLVAPAHHPQHFAEVRADLGIGPPAVGASRLWFASRSSCASATTSCTSWSGLSSAARFR